MLSFQAVFELAPAQLIPTAASLIEGGKFDTKVNYGDRSTQDVVDDITVSVSARVHVIVARHHPEVVHVFTHGGEDIPRESRAGVFVNRGKFWSTLRKTSSLDHYLDVVVPIVTKPGIVAFETEAVLTQTADPSQTIPIHQDC